MFNRTIDQDLVNRLFISNSLTRFLKDRQLCYLLPLSHGNTKIVEFYRLINLKYRANILNCLFKRSHVQQSYKETDVLKHSWVDCSRIAEKYGGPNVSRQFQFYSRQFQFYSPAISICSRLFQFTHRDFNLLTATISIYLRQFQFTRGNFNFAHGNFNLLTAISTFSRQRSRHFSLSSQPVYYGGRQWSPKVKKQIQKSILKVDLQSEK